MSSAGRVREIPLTREKVALVDEADFLAVSAHKWYAASDKKAWYAKRGVWDGARERVQAMHRFILTPPAGVQVDHINGNGLDNRRANLRLANQRENQANQKKNCGTSPYKGVSRNRCQWQAQIAVGGRKTALGRFANPVDAALAYDLAALAAWGEFARPNFLRWAGGTT